MLVSMFVLLRSLTPTCTSAMRMLESVLSWPSRMTPVEPGILLPTMLTSEMSQSDEPLFAPYFM